MQVRNTQIHDIDKVMEILMEGKRSLASLGIDQWQGGNYPNREAIEEDIALQEGYVVEDAEGKLHASAMISFRGEEDYAHIEQGAWLSDSSSDKPDYAVIHRVAVAHESKGLGFASFLLREAETLCRTRGARSIRIDTHPGNKPMLKLLEKQGYTRCGIIYIAHADGTDPTRIACEKILK